MRHAPWSRAADCAALTRSAVQSTCFFFTVFAWLSIIADWNRLFILLHLRDPPRRLAKLLQMSDEEAASDEASSDEELMPKSARDKPRPLLAERGKAPPLVKKSRLERYSERVVRGAFSAGRAAEQLLVLFIQVSMLAVVARPVASGMIGAAMPPPPAPPAAR